MKQDQLLPKCECGSCVGLSVQDGRYWCPDCLWKEIERLQVVLRASRVVLDTCRASMRPLVEKGVRHPRTEAMADQFAAAWGDLQKAVEATEAH